MSTTATAPESQTNSPTLGIPPEQAFDELAFHDPTVCSRCFSLIRKRDTFRPDVGIGGVSKYAPEERLIRWYDGERGYKTEATNEYGYRPLHNPRTFCSDCGSQSGRAEDIDLSRRTAILFTENLLTRLREAGVHVDQQALKYTVGTLKSDERLEGADTEIFRRAVKLGIKHARHE